MSKTSVIIIGVAILIGAGVFISRSSLVKQDGPLASVSPTANPSASVSPSAGAVKGVVAVRSNGTVGPYLTDSKGMTLYVSGKDPKLQSACTGACTQTWKPFLFHNENWRSYTDLAHTRLNVIQRPDGTSQYAYGEKPLYYYSGDAQPGDVNGNGVDTTWAIVLVTK